MTINDAPTGRAWAATLSRRRAGTRRAGRVQAGETRAGNPGDRAIPQDGRVIPRSPRKPPQRRRDTARSCTSEAARRPGMRAADRVETVTGHLRDRRQIPRAEPALAPANDEEPHGRTVVTITPDHRLCRAGAYPPVRQPLPSAESGARGCQAAMLIAVCRSYRYGRH